MPTLNYSKQRQAILEHLQSRKDHPTAEMIYHTLRKSMPNLSAGTVYRNLGLLTELGQVKKLAGLDGVDPGITEAATGMGMTRLQLLWKATRSRTR